jgi:PncC family amidohydrolase
MEHAVLSRLRSRGWTLGVAESLTGGLIGARIVNVPGASDTFRGTIASYATEVKRSVLGVTAESVVSEEAAREMAEGARRAPHRRPPMPLRK